MRRDALVSASFGRSYPFIEFLVSRDSATQFNTLAKKMMSAPIVVSDGLAWSDRSGSLNLTLPAHPLEAGDLPLRDRFGIACRSQDMQPKILRRPSSRGLAIGIGTILETDPGVRICDAPGFPAEGRAFSLGHAAELEAVRRVDVRIDWVVLAPPPTLLDEYAPRRG